MQAPTHNLPAVRVLQTVGAKRFVAALRQAGATLALPGGAAATLPVALGGVGISLQDLAMLYVGLADGGRVAPVGVLPAAAAKGEAIMTPLAAAEIGGILRGAPLPDGVAANNRQVAFKPARPTASGMPGPRGIRAIIPSSYGSGGSMAHRAPVHMAGRQRRR